MSKSLGTVAREFLKAAQKYSHEHDDKHGYVELADAGAYYAFNLADTFPTGPNVPGWIQDEHTKHLAEGMDAREALVRAGAFILSSLDTLDRAEERLGIVRCFECGWKGMKVDLVEKMKCSLCPKCSTIVTWREDAQLVIPVKWPAHTQRLTTRDRDDRPCTPTCVVCGKAEEFCIGSKP